MHTFTVLSLLVGGVAGWGYCSDNDASCASWAKSGECEKSFIKTLCPHSCRACTHVCRDLQTDCPQWAEKGECESNSEFMLGQCPVSCGICKTRCYDKDPQCLSWARGGECAKNRDMLTLCPESCGICTDLCLDKQDDCPQWAAQGECNKNPAYTLKENAAVPHSLSPTALALYTPSARHVLSRCPLNLLKHACAARVLQECPASCGVCTADTHTNTNHPTVAAKKPRDAGHTSLTDTNACYDTDRLQCLIWGEHECGHNPASMMRLCPHTCGLCTLGKHATIRTLCALERVGSAD